MRQLQDNSLIPLCLALILCIALNSNAWSHAGHDDIPEAAAASIGDLPPRFYARTEAVDATLILSDEDSGELYLVRHDTNLPVAGTVKVEQLTPSSRSLEVANGETSGVYTVRPLDSLSTTATLSVEVEDGDLFEILSFSNVIRPAGASELHGSVHNGNDKSTLPIYIKVSLIAVNALVALLACVGLLKYLFTRKRGASHAAILLAVILHGASARGHEGDSHTGEGLASNAGAVAMSSFRHFVPVTTQLQTDVQTSIATVAEMPDSFSALGRIIVRPDMEAAITAPADGLLVLNVSSDQVPIAGDTVKKGQVLVRLQMIIPAQDKVTISTEKVTADADLNQAKQETLLAGQELERAIKLGTYVSKSEVDRLQTTYRIARDKEAGLLERVQTLAAALEGDTTGVKTLDLRAPIDGVISESHSTLGEYVNAGKSLFRIVNIDKLFVEGDVFETDISQVENATRARVTVEGYPDRQFSGEFHSLSPEIDPLRRTAKVLFSIDNREHLLKAGMFANIHIETGKPAATLLVPKSAIVSRDNLRQVYRKAGPEIFDAIFVNVVRFLADYAVITPGTIKAGDVLVTRGHYQVRMGPVVGEAQ